MIRSSERRVTRRDELVPARLAAIMFRYDLAVAISDADLCLHCRQHQCIAVCPTGSLTTRRDGRVSLDSSTCCGCTACVQVCREFDNLESGVRSQESGMSFP